MLRSRILGIVPLQLLFSALSSQAATAQDRTVFGTIKHSDGSPADNARIRIIDVDPTTDEVMGEVRTNAHGNYTFTWPARQIWDPPRSNRYTWWRPDIQVKVKWSAENDNQWDAEGQSGVRNDLRHNTSHRFDLTLTPISRTISGVVRDRFRVVQGLRVRAWDKDPVTDQAMGREALTDAQGRYSITYASGVWDSPRVPRTNSWRPDIFVTIAARRENGSWSRQFVSPTRNDHPLRNPLTIDVTLTGKCGLGEPVNCSCPQLATFVAPHTNISNRLFAAACVRHDYCYRHGRLTYNKSKQACDNDFLAHMRRICLNPGPILVPGGLGTCQAWANEYFAAVRLAGGSAYRPNGAVCRYESP